MRKFLALVLALLPLGTFAQEKVVFMPHWTPQAQFVGYYLALEKGFYSDQGLNVEIQHPSQSKSTFDSLNEGECQFTTTFLIAAMLRYSNGAEVTNVMQTSQGSTQLVVAHRPISSASDLKGLKIARWSVGFNTLGEILDKELGLDIQWIPTIWNVGIYKSWAVDAIMCQSYNELFQLMASGEEISSDQMLYMSEAGFNVPEDGLYALRSYCEQNPEVVAKFVAASKKGWQYAYEHRDEALAITMKYVDEAGVVTNAVAQKWMLNHVLDVVYDGDFDMCLSQSVLDRVNMTLKNNGFITTVVPYDKFVWK